MRSQVLTLRHLVALALVLAACGGDEGSTTTRDGGPNMDGSSRVDGSGGGDGDVPGDDGTVAPIPDGGPIEDGAVRLVQGHHANGRIFYWSAVDDGDTTLHATEELARYLNVMGPADVAPFAPPVRFVCAQAGLASGIALVTDSALDVADDATKCAWFGASGSQLDTGVSAVADAYGWDTFPKTGVAERLLVAGNTARGTLYGVYDVLGHLGARFYAPSYSFYRSDDGRDLGEDIPVAQGTLDLAPSTVREAPAMLWRKKDLANNWSHNASTLRQLADWMAKNRLNVLQLRALYRDVYIRSCTGTCGNLTCEETPAYDGTSTTSYETSESAYDAFRNYRFADTGRTFVEELRRRGILLEVGGHGYQRWLPDDVYAPLCPAWFDADPDVNVFRVSNAAARAEYVANVVRYLEAHPEVDIFDAWPPDSARWSAADMAAFNNNPQNGEATLLNELRASVAARPSIAHIRIETLAYPSLTPSTPGGLAPPDRVAYHSDILVDLACYGRSYSERIYEDGNVPACATMNCRCERVFADWRSSGFFDGEMGIYEYYRRQIWHSLPVQLHDFIAGSSTQQSEIGHYVRGKSGYPRQGYTGLGFYAEAADWLTYENTHYLGAYGVWSGADDFSPFVRSYISERFGAVAEHVRVYFAEAQAAGRALYGTPRGYWDLAHVSDARTHLMAAKDALVLARDAARTANLPVLRVVERLLNNAWFSIYDLEVAYFDLMGNTANADTRREWVRDRIALHQFDGAVLQSSSLWTGDPWSPYDTAHPPPTERCIRAAYRNILGACPSCPTEAECGFGNSGF